ncbi:hypothetical protein CDL15_Pgr019474 [Punica granatum]|uniref:Uncharacterized protein n=1 Tax=Punica granatum TaxID=22663 RepID=A0A218VSQ5_PUNGR|nr:hypothetical protein CDL15_Pgr019474 [Punica granatum]PKI62827.1 hypothetical protein CRG98_016778 [Punica granatum]
MNCTDVNLGGVQSCARFLSLPKFGLNSASQECSLGLQTITQVAVRLENTTTCRCILMSLPVLGQLLRTTLLVHAQMLSFAQGQGRFILGANTNIEVLLEYMLSTY